MKQAKLQIPERLGGAEFALVEVRYLDGGVHIHRQLVVEEVAEPFALESCNADDLAHARPVRLAHASHVVGLGDREWCGRCCADMRGGES